ncbi:LPXTG cell wall anchor domain-containing protein [Streptomyces fradiae]|uniref:LPXTG cell wall anchor domain-containing protein n=1 Tax=Streptomyces fradiae TaxID=1906 RepID=UPI003404A041
MKTTRTLATAVAAAVTAPLLLLAAAPAYATTVTPPPAAPPVSAPTPSPSPAAFGKKPSIAELEKAVAQARKAHQDAVAVQEAALKELKKSHRERDWPEAVALVAAEKEAETATAAHTAAVKAREEAEAKLAALPGTATPEEREAAEKAVETARTTEATAATTKATADAKRAAADDTYIDRYIEDVRAYSLLRKAVETAAADLAAAEKALEDAKKNGDGGGDDDGDGMCKGDDRLVAELTGLPAKVTAGGTVDFTVRVTNNTGEAVDRAYGRVTLAPGTHTLVPLFKPRYAVGTSTTWRDWNSWGIDVNVGALKPGAHADLRLRLSPSAKLEKWSGRIEVSGSYERDGECAANTTLKSHTFQVVAATPSPTPTPTANTPAPQGGTKTAPLTGTTTTAATTGGTLAKTGSSDALNGLAVASGAAVLLGAAAVYGTRRRRTTGA